MNLEKNVCYKKHILLPTRLNISISINQLSLVGLVLLTSGLNVFVF